MNQQAAELWTANYTEQHSIFFLFTILATFFWTLYICRVQNTLRVHAQYHTHRLYYYNNQKKWITYKLWVSFVHKFFSNFNYTNWMSSTIDFVPQTDFGGRFRRRRRRCRCCCCCWGFFNFLFQFSSHPMFLYNFKVGGKTIIEYK